MPRLDWGAAGERFYETGVDRGVLYVGDSPGVPWIGLTAVSENPSGGESKPYYIDGVKYLNTSAPEEYAGTISAYTYPDEFAPCDGYVMTRQGFYTTAQRRREFNLSYRTKVGSDLSEDAGYKIHLLYNALASPTERSNTTIGDSIDPNDFSWAITTRPPRVVDRFVSAHYVVDSRTTDPGVLSTIEDILYGTEENDPRIPGFMELLGIFDAATELVVIDNGDGTWTATAPFDVIRMIDVGVFEITHPNAELAVDEETFTVSSA